MIPWYSLWRYILSVIFVVTMIGIGVFILMTGQFELYSILVVAYIVGAILLFGAMFR